MNKYKKGDRTIVGKIIQVDLLNDGAEPRYVIEDENNNYVVINEHSTSKIILPVIDFAAAYKIVDAKRHGMGLAEFIRRYANESEHTLETLVTAWIYGYMEQN